MKSLLFVRNTFYSLLLHMWKRVVAFFAIHTIEEKKFNAGICCNRCGKRRFMHRRRGYFTLFTSIPANVLWEDFLCANCETSFDYRRWVKNKEEIEQIVSHLIRHFLPWLWKWFVVLFSRKSGGGEACVIPTPHVCPSCMRDNRLSEHGPTLYMKRYLLFGFIATNARCRQVECVSCHHILSKTYCTQHGYIITQA